MKKEIVRSLLTLFTLLLAGALAFFGLFHLDNKYTAALPGGQGEAVLQKNPEQVAFLVDGWEYYPGRLLAPGEFQGKGEKLYTYIGEYPNFSAYLDSPYGEATYRLLLRNNGEEQELSLFLPELFCAGKIYLNGSLAGEQGSLVPYRPLAKDGVYSFFAGKETELVIQCANYSHYYSGLYYPPAVGTPGAVSKMLAGRMIVYGFLCFFPLAAALSNLALWAVNREKRSRRLGLLCLFFALRMSYPFFRALGVPLLRPLYALEDFCGNAVLLCAVLLAGELSGAAVRWYHRKAAIPLAVGLCAFSVIFPLFILPYAPLFINPYGLLLSLWKLLAGAYLLFLALRGGKEQGGLGRYLLCAAGLYGGFVALSMLTVNLFEPICGAWPEEYGGFLLVLGFLAAVVRQGRLMAAENRRLTLHLQKEVDHRTRALEKLLAERRELLAGLVHDVKNPLTAVRNYTQLVRGGEMAMDAETAGYLDALEERIGAVEDRLSALQGFSRGEQALFSAEPLCLNSLLQEFYEANRPDMELSGQSFLLRLPEERLRIRGDGERLKAALENLCYNALSFTPEEGVITLSLCRQENQAVISVTDTGSGIPPELLPHVFDRGFTRRPDGGGNGLGLYIVRTVALEHGGTVEAESQPQKGAAFTLRLPLLP